AGDALGEIGLSPALGGRREPAIGAAAERGGQREQRQRGAPHARSSSRLSFVSSERTVRARSLGCSTTSATSLVRNPARASGGSAKRTKWTALSLPRSSSEWPLSKSPTITCGPTVIFT